MGSVRATPVEVHSRVFPVPFSYFPDLSRVPHLGVDKAEDGPRKGLKSGMLLFATGSLLQSMKTSWRQRGAKLQQVLSHPTR